jgi:hypothetical protein
VEFPIKSRFERNAISGYLLNRSRACVVDGRLDLRQQDNLQEISTFFWKRMSEIGVPVFSPSQFEDYASKGLADFDIVGLVGSYQQLRSIQDTEVRIKSSQSRIAFLELNDYRAEEKEFVQISDAAVCCNSEFTRRNDEKNRLSYCYDVIFHFFESLTFPSLLNIDVSDVKNIARGFGFALCLEEDRPEQIVERIPEICCGARAALLHFNCSEDVTLKEVYSISKAIARRREEKYQYLLDQDANPEQKKLFRKMNLKMGIRIDEGDEFSSPGGNLAGETIDRSLSKVRRIRMTGIFFGIRRSR